MNNIKIIELRNKYFDIKKLMFEYGENEEVFEEVDNIVNIFELIIKNGNIFEILEINDISIVDYLIGYEIFVKSEYKDLFVKINNYFINY